MRAAGTIMAVVLMTTGLVIAQEAKVPKGCVAVKGAAISHDGYASGVIHQKTGVELVLVPAGSFTRGKHKVTIAKPFYVGKTEVTNAQYKRFITQSGYDGRKDVDPAYEMYLLHLRGKSIMPSGDNFPVIFVSWRNAKAFCRWAGALDLPTAGEWEYSCRAGTTGNFHFGNEIGNYPQYGWATENSGGRPHKVAQLKPNAWGLHDMHGNVWEWCLDDYWDSNDALPSDGSARQEAGLMAKALRGGTWSAAARVSRADWRFSSAPTNATNDMGFRLVLRLP